MRARGLRVTTEIPKAEGTGQYYTWAREVGLRAFVSSELETLGRRQRATFLVWSGSQWRRRRTLDGDRAHQAAAPDGGAGILAATGPFLSPGPAAARMARKWGPGPTQRINAGLAQDEVIGGTRAGRRRISPLLR